MFENTRCQTDAGRRDGCHSTAEEVVSKEVEVCTDHTCSAKKPLSPAAREMAEEMYRNVTMGVDSYLHMLPHVGDSRIQTDMTGALCYYEKLAGKLKTILTDAGLEPKEGSMMAKMSARAGIAMNTMMDKTDSHIAEMLIEGATMSVTTAQKLRNHAEGKEDCAELCELASEWSKFEETHMETLKKFL